MSEPVGEPALPDVLDEEDPLLVAQREAEANEAAGGSETDNGEPKPELGEQIDYGNADELLKEFFAEVREVDRDNEVNRILGAFKLNPYEQLGVKFDADTDDINRRYRKTSLLVHPDKCTHPRAKDAFDMLKQAQQALLDEETRKELDYLIAHSKDVVRQERAKKTKKDQTVRLASMIHEDGREGLEAQWETTDEFHHLWKLQARDVLAKNAWRKRKLTKRLKDDEERVKEEEKSEGDRLKKLREHEKGWEKTRETRVGSWRDFVKGKEGKDKKKKTMGGLKPPKIKTHDEERTYVQRPVGEQFRPPPAAVPKPNRQ